MREDLVKVDSWILDLDDRDYGTSVTAYEELKQTCSHNWEAFKYLQERMHDVKISECSVMIFPFPNIFLQKRIVYPGGCCRLGVGFTSPANPETKGATMGVSPKKIPLCFALGRSKAETVTLSI